MAENPNTSELRGIKNPYDPRSTQDSVRDTAELLGIERLRARVTAGANASGTRRWTVQIIDRKGQAVRTRAVVRVHIATSQGGPPGGSQTVAWVGSDTVRFTYTVSQDWDLTTDENGQAQADVTDSGETLYMHAVVHSDAQTGAGSY